MDIARLLEFLGPGGFLGLGGLLVSIYVAVGNRRMATTDALDKLCTQLQNRLNTVEAELERLRGENSALKERVRELEEERDRLKEQIERLSARRRRKSKGEGR